MIRYPSESTPWPFWKKIGFRFFFIYFLLQLAPWTWLEAIPGMDAIFKYYYAAADWVVYAANRHVFHVKEVLVPFNGSGDTSYGWAQLWTYLSLAGVGCVVWTIVDRKSTNYPKAAYWLRTLVRYAIAMVAFFYGIIKLFALQMVFPNQSQLATPLGDFLPMRFSWLFIGYSMAVVMPFVETWERYQTVHKAPAPQPIPAGIYEVRRYMVNKDTLCSWAADSLHWKDIILENGGYGSINTTDTLFRQRYRRGYFIYATDSIQHTLAFKKMMGDSLPFLTLRYERPGGNRLRLWTKLREDSLYLELVKSNQHFQLTEKQFHWLSEANR